MVKHILIVLTLCSALAAPSRHKDRAEWRSATGLRHVAANRDGSSSETGLPSTWDIKGSNLLWRAPFGGRSAPIVMGNRVYVQNPSGRGPALQERVMALDADTGKMLWDTSSTFFKAMSLRIVWAGRRLRPIPKPATSTR